MKIKNLAKFGTILILLVAFFSIWELLLVNFQVSNRILPSPSAVISSLFINWEIITPHAYQTIIETLIGFTFAIVFGVGTALLLDLNPYVKKALFPILITSQTIPMIALAPILLIWFGFGLLPKVIMVILFCFFPIAIATSLGLSSIDKDLIKLLKSMNASYFQILRHARFQSALPQFFAGLKIAAAYSITAAIAGEYVGAYRGLGIYMQNVNNSQATELLFAAILVSTVLSMLLFGLVILVEKICIPWKRN